MNELNVSSLSLRLLKKIFRHLKYEQLVILRDVCESFCQAASGILNHAFLDLNLQLRTQLECAQDEIGSARSMSSRSLARILSRYKTLEMMQSEYHALECVCSRYVTRGMYCFVGGAILDHMYGVLELKSAHSVENVVNFERRVTATLATLCEEFADHFEDKIEPPLLKMEKQFVFGSKVVDLLDSFLSSNYHLVVTPEKDGEVYHLAGCYEVFSSPEGVLTPPAVAGGGSTVASLSAMRALVRYLRNAARWHNLCHCINTTSRARHRRLRLRLDCPDTSSDDRGDSIKPRQTVFKRSSYEAEDNSLAGLTCGLVLRCARDAAPRRLASITGVGRSEVPEMAVALKDGVTSVDYEFSLELKVHYTALEGTCEVVKEAVLMLYQTPENCLMQQFSKNLNT